MLNSASPSPERSASTVARTSLLISAACLVPALLDAAQTYVQWRLNMPTPSAWATVAFQGGEWLILGMLAPLTWLLARRFPLRRPWRARNVAAHVAGALVLCVLWAAAGVALRWALGTLPEIPLGRHFASWTLTSLPWSVFLYFTILGSVHAVAYFVEAREREAQAARLAAQLAEARLGALRAQLNPHFLFNSLNAITVLVRDQETRAAARMLELLSDVLRQVLRGGGAHEVPLAHELDFLRRYLEIEQVRFSDRLRVRFDVGDGLHDAAVPEFILQPLVENALRHGLAKRGGVGTIEVVARRERDALLLAVRDDGAGVRAAEAGGEREGLGLANARERLRTLYGDAAQVTLGAAPTGGAEATIRVPFRTVAAPPAGPPLVAASPSAADASA